MGLGDLFNWRGETAVPKTASMPAIADEDLAADVDEPPEPQRRENPSDFYKNTIQFVAPRKESLLTKALKSPDLAPTKPDCRFRAATDLVRRRSMMSNASLASTAELTSDGGLTSPARTNTPSPPPPSATYSNFAPFSLSGKPVHPPSTSSITSFESKISASHVAPHELSVSPGSRVTACIAPKRRCITFACGATKTAKAAQVSAVVPQPAIPAPPVTEAPKRECRIKFACSGPKPSEVAKQTEALKIAETPMPMESVKRSTGRSSSSTRKSPRPGVTTRASHRDSTGTVRRASQSPAAIRTKPKYIIADEKTIQEFEATRFHEFASEVMEDDDWIRKDSVVHMEKMTISDTLKKENAIRQLGNEAEAEALEEDENEDEDNNVNDSDNESGFDDDDDEENEDSMDESEANGSDGNESDNEAGFADSDDENGDDELAFWTPGRHILYDRTANASTYRPSAHRTASTSSIDSLKEGNGNRKARRIPMRPLRPGTPDLPDSTDFPCGTLDEDRPLEDAYKSCMEARRNAKHLRTPQDIDPSFPTSDPEDEEDEHDILPPTVDSEEHAWHQGKFEDSDDERVGRRRSVAGRRKSPGQSPRPKRLHSPPPPKRLHSPPPAKSRLRSPPPRKLFGGHSPRPMRSPPARAIKSPPGSPTWNSATAAIAFAPLGSRPGLTHTKSLPRTPNAFCRAYNASRLIAANGNNDDDGNDGHVRGAIDIVKGLEQKRQRRKEKFYQKHYNRKGKPHTERKPQPGKGAERMRELGLLMAGKIGGQGNPLHMMSA
jgi:hypothetical protein